MPLISLILKRKKKLNHLPAKFNLPFASTNRTDHENRHSSPEFFGHEIGKGLKVYRCMRECAVDIMSMKNRLIRLLDCSPMIALGRVGWFLHFFDELLMLLQFFLMLLIPPTLQPSLETLRLRLPKPVGDTIEDADTRGV
jgi:hypothetical protein